MRPVHYFTIIIIIISLIPLAACPGGKDPNQNKGSGPDINGVWYDNVCSKMEIETSSIGRVWGTFANGDQADFDCAKRDEGYELNGTYSDGVLKFKVDFNGPPPPRECYTTTSWISTSVSSDKIKTKYTGVYSPPDGPVEKFEGENTFTRECPCSSGCATGS